VRTLLKVTDTGYLFSGQRLVILNAIFIMRLAPGDFECDIYYAAGTW
jgi:hypothetical protein